MIPLPNLSLPPHLLLLLLLLLAPYYYWNRIDVVVVDENDDDICLWHFGLILKRVIVIESTRIGLLLFLIISEKIALGELIVNVNLHHSN